MSRLIRQSLVGDSLQRLGYRTIAVATDWGITDNRSADIYLAPKHIVATDFEYFLLGLTPLGLARPLLSKVAFVHSNEAHRELIRFALRSLRTIPAISGPKFVFAHIVAPHPPFVFQSDGGSADPGYEFAFADGGDYPWNRDRYLEGYIRQLQFINGELQEVVDDILEHSKTPPVILLQADHGPGMLTDLESIENTCFRERFSAFGAYHLPGVDPDGISPDLSPVNLFRVVFNQYFSAGLPLVPNSHYFNRRGFSAFDSQDVTVRVNSCSPRPRP